VNGARCRANPRNKNQESAPASPADGASFPCRGHDPIQAGLLRQTRELDRANWERSGKTDLSHFRSVQARQHSNAQKLGRVWFRCNGAPGGQHHFQATRGMEGEQSHSRQLRSGRDGSGHSVRDVVEFQVKENTGGEA
jgi:hypothetical protein